MEASATQAVRKVQGAGQPQAALNEHILSLVSLPAREELARAASGARPYEPRLLTAAETSQFTEAKKKLEKTLAEIDCRLSTSPENLPHQLKAAGRVNMKGDDRIALTIGPGMLSFFLGIIACVFGGVSAETGVPLVAAFTVSSPVVANVLPSVLAAFKQFSAAGTLLFNSAGSPSRRVLKGILNPLVRIRGLFYKGPSSDVAREFDREIEALEKKGGSRENEPGCIRMAKEGLVFAGKKAAAELSLVSKRLSADSGLREGLKMFERLTAGVAIPEAADTGFLEKTASATEALIKTLDQYKKDRRLSLPGDMYELTYFAQIISHLEKNLVDEADVAWFFDRFKRALEQRLEQAQRALKDSGKVEVPDARTVIP